MAQCTMTDLEIIVRAPIVKIETTEDSEALERDGPSDPLIDNIKTYGIMTIFMRGIEVYIVLLSVWEVHQDF